MDYKEYNDYELLNYIVEGNEEALEIIYKKYMPLISNTAKKMYKYTSQNGIEINDLVQEGLLGLSKAISEYKTKKDVMFYTFAKTCIERRIISAVIASRRLKHKILNDSISYDADFKDKSYSIDSFVKDNESNPENVLLENEDFNEVLSKMSDKLTDFELQVFELRISGFDYKEIAEVLDKDPKAIDNCLHRIKQKLKKIIDEKI